MRVQVKTSLCQHDIVTCVEWIWLAQVLSLHAKYSRLLGPLAFTKAST
jgi:hypothetical protein